MSGPGRGRADGEFALIARLGRWLDTAGGPVVVGPGDDAAVVHTGGDVVVAVDAMVEGRHFDLALSSLADVGWKALAVNVSDLAAMGATPLAAVVSLCRPATTGAGDVGRLYTGMREAADRWGVALVGGDTVAADELVLSVTVLGSPPPTGVVTRDGARPGDRIVVVGTLGAAAAGLALHRAGLPVPIGPGSAHRRPWALPGPGAALAAAGATAMIDVSDGLGADLAHVCAASGVAAVVHAARLPQGPGVGEAAHATGRDPLDLVVAGGDDYALVAAMPPTAAAALPTAFAGAAGDAPVGVTEVGYVLAPGELPAVWRGEVPEDLGAEPVLLTGGRASRMAARGFDHFGPE